MTEKELPALFQDTDTAARHSQKRYMFLISTNLILGIVGAAIAYLSGVIQQSAWTLALSIVAALALFAALFLRASMRDPLSTSLDFMSQGYRRWFDERALAEHVKMSAWQYAMRSKPFENDATADDDFLEYLTKLRHLNDDLLRNVKPGKAEEQITPRMREIRAISSLDDRKETYLKGRLQDQTNYYSRRSEEHR
jgi:hypothetical protein